MKEFCLDVQGSHHSWVSTNVDQELETQECTPWTDQTLESFKDSRNIPLALGLNPGPLLSLGVTARHDLGLSLCLAVTSQE